MLSSAEKRAVLKDLIGAEEQREKRLRVDLKRMRAELLESDLKIEAMTRLFEGLVKDEHGE